MAEINNGEVRFQSCRFGAYVKEIDKGELSVNPPAPYEAVQSFVCVNYFLRQEKMREKVLASHPDQTIYEVALIHPRGRITESKVQLALYQGCLDCPYYEPRKIVSLANRLKS